MKHLFNQRAKLMKNICKLSILVCIASVWGLEARRCAFKSSGYAKKAAYSGYGKVSPISKQVKTKVTSGHFKKTTRGMTFVNPYARTNK